MTPVVLASLVALRLDGPEGLCPAWMDSADRRCDKPATVGLLCARHDKVARARAEKSAERDARDAERSAARRDAARPKALARLEWVEARIAGLSVEPTTDTAVVNIPRSSRQWRSLDSKVAEVAALYRERESLLWARS